MSTTLKMSNGDLAVDGAGRTVDIRGIEKSAQDMAEAFLNNYDSHNPYYFNGSEFWRLDTMTFPKGGATASTTIETMARDAIKRLQELQEDDPYVDDDELIAEIRVLRAQPIGQLSYAFYCLAITDSNDPAAVGFDIDLLQQLPAGIAQTGGRSAPGTGTPL